MACRRAACFAVLLTLAAGPLCAQTPGVTRASGLPVHIRVDAEHLFPPEPRTFVAHHDTGATVEPLIPLEPLLDHLPLQLIPELLRTEQRLTFRFDNYSVQPRVRLHEIAIVITRKLPS